MSENSDENDQEDTSAVVAALAAVQEQLAEEKERRREERFIWIIVSVTLLDLFLLDRNESATVTVVVFSLELIALVVIVRRLGIKNAAVFIDRVTSAIVKKEMD